VADEETERRRIAPSALNLRLPAAASRPSQDARRGSRAGVPRSAQAWRIRPPPRDNRAGSPGRGRALDGVGPKKNVTEP
jgi:hypothetical protein